MDLWYAFYVNVITLILRLQDKYDLPFLFVENYPISIGTR
jgi:hypothetical protein